MPVMDLFENLMGGGSSAHLFQISATSPPRESLEKGGALLLPRGEPTPGNLVWFFFSQLGGIALHQARSEAESPMLQASQEAAAQVQLFGPDPGAFMDLERGKSCSLLYPACCT